MNYLANLWRGLRPNKTVARRNDDALAHAESRAREGAALVAEALIEHRRLTARVLELEAELAKQSTLTRLGHDLVHATLRIREAVNRRSEAELKGWPRSADNDREIERANKHIVDLIFG